MKTRRLYANYHYSLTSQQQSMIQLFLRLCVPDAAKESPAYGLLHDLTYAASWTEEPECTLAGEVTQ